MLCRNAAVCCSLATGVCCQLVSHDAWHIHVQARTVDKGHQGHCIGKGHKGHQYAGFRAVLLHHYIPRFASPATCQSTLWLRLHACCCHGCLQALQVVEQHMLWDAPDIRVTSREDLRLATYIFHQVWDFTWPDHQTPRSCQSASHHDPGLVQLCMHNTRLGCHNLHAWLHAWPGAIGGAQL